MAIPIAPLVAQFRAPFAIDGVCVCVHGGESLARNEPSATILGAFALRPRCAKHGGTMSTRARTATGEGALSGGRLRTVVQNRTCACHAPRGHPRRLRNGVTTQNELGREQPQLSVACVFFLGCEEMGYNAMCLAYFFGVDARSPCF
jgi:hypothetical protein